MSCAVHTHCDFCDGSDSMQAMAQAAWKAGVKHFGVSCHAHTNSPMDEGIVMDADMRPYRQAVQRLREDYAGRMEVLLGLEWDSTSDVESEGFDYWIGSVHNLYDSVQDAYYPVDWKVEHLKACAQNCFGGDMAGVVQWYYKEVAKVAQKNPTILGHLDLITKLNGDGALFDESSPWYQNCAEEALAMANPKETLLEINTGGMFRGYRTMPYPALFLLQQWKAMGGEIILTSDAHSTQGILFGYEQGAAVAKQAGFSHHCLLTATGKTSVKLE